jgi:hypothetical protein
MDASVALPFTFELEYRPYKINASLDEDLSVLFATYLSGKLGRERAEHVKRMVSAQGEKLGIKLCVPLSLVRLC